MNLKIVAISDTHGIRPWFRIPAGDVLVHAGDMTRHGRLDEVIKFNKFLETLPHPYKLVVAGNHDICFETQPEASRACLTNCIYLQDQTYTVQKVKFYGSPWQPTFRNMAFNLERGAALRAKWALIPPDTNVLITHGPPWKQCDRTLLSGAVGCLDLLQAIEKLNIRLHIFGHIHEAAGQSSNGRTLFVNASLCNLLYLPIHRPFVYDYEL